MPYFCLLFEIFSWLRRILIHFDIQITVIVTSTQVTEIPRKQTCQHVNAWVRLAMSCVLSRNPPLNLFILDKSALDMTVMFCSRKKIKMRVDVWKGSCWNLMHHFKGQQLIQPHYYEQMMHLTQLVQLVSKKR